MTKVKRGYVIVVFFLSVVATILNITALGTQNWVNAKGEISGIPNEALSVIHYGLFEGYLEQNLGSKIFYELKTTCDFSINICAMLCGNTGSERHDELISLYNGETVNFNTLCPQVTRLFDFPRKIEGRADDGERDFMNAGVWLSTVIFLCFSSLFGLVATLLSFYNSFWNPVERLLNIYGLYIYNSVACFCSLLTVLLWGILFATYMINNVGILYTITDRMDTSGWAYLGYSYWLNLVAMIIYATNITLLYIRQYLINKEPIVDINLDDTNDPAIYLY